METAAVLEQLDLLITVDTAAAHLAGALGRPVWTILCHTPDWRWHLGRIDSPWYPTMAFSASLAGATGIPSVKEIGDCLTATGPSSRPSGRS